ncbi:MAG: NAD(+)/NADH kinase [Clostridia bacterium]|nr:NAD(+)/NADH kinase [Clostridia bacterium]
MSGAFYFYANPYQPKSESAARALARQLQDRGAEVLSDPWLARRGVGRECDLGEVDGGTRAIVVFGGDGTLLRAAPDAAIKGIPLLGVHTGTVGFLMPGEAEKPAETAALLLKPDYPLADCPLLEVCYRGESYLAVNDLSFARGEHPGVMEVTVEADGELVFCAHGDGVVVSTPLGCTAYGLSAGGPVVRPDAQCLMVTPLCARELTLRPVILPLHAQVTLSAHGSERRRFQLAVDGQTLLPVTEEAHVALHAARERLRLIRPDGISFFDTLRKKQINWNRDCSAME